MKNSLEGKKINKERINVKWHGEKARSIEPTQISQLFPALPLNSAPSASNTGIWNSATTHARSISINYTYSRLLAPLCHLLASPWPAWIAKIAELTLHMTSK